MIENPFFAGTSDFSSGIAIVFSERIEIMASCTSDAQRVISSKRASVPDSIALNIALGMSASGLGPRAISIA